MSPPRREAKGRNDNKKTQASGPNRKVTHLDLQVDLQPSQQQIDRAEQYGNIKINNLSVVVDGRRGPRFPSSTKSKWNSLIWLLLSVILPSSLRASQFPLNQNQPLMSLRMSYPPFALTAFKILAVSLTCEYFLTAWTAPASKLFLLSTSCPRYIGMLMLCSGVPVSDKEGSFFMFKPPVRCG